MHVIEAQLDIPAAAGPIWEVLTDFGSYKEWNPYLVDADGPITRGGRFLEGEPIERGCRIAVRLSIPGRKTSAFRPVLSVFEPQRRLGWSGHFGLPGVLDRSYLLSLDPIESGTRVTQREEFSGLLAGLTGGGRIGELTGEQFGAMNEALRRRVRG